jgi:Rrf2 family protein
MSFLNASTKEQYGLRLALRLADTYASQLPVSLSMVALAEHISTKYLEELILPLKKAGLVKAVYGRHGGYIFMKDPRQVSVKEVLWLIDGSPQVTNCVAAEYECPHGARCTAQVVWREVQLQVEKTLTKITLAQLSAHKKKV